MLRYLRKEYVCLPPCSNSSLNFAEFSRARAGPLAGCTASFLCSFTRESQPVKATQTQRKAREANPVPPFIG